MIDRASKYRHFEQMQAEGQAFAKARCPVANKVTFASRKKARKVAKLNGQYEYHCRCGKWHLTSRQFSAAGASNSSASATAVPEVRRSAA